MDRQSLNTEMQSLLHSRRKNEALLQTALVFHCGSVLKAAKSTLKKKEKSYLETSLDISKVL